MHINPTLVQKLVLNGAGRICQVGVDLPISTIRPISDFSLLTEEEIYNRIALRAGYAYEIRLVLLNMPKDMFGYIVGRSTYNRSGVLIRSSIIDPGYVGLIGVTAYTFTNSVILSTGDFVAQLLCFKAEAAASYCGQYQNEGL